MRIGTIWNGTDQEAQELCRIVTRNCECGAALNTRTYCAPHRMLIRDQRALDGLLFARHIVVRLLREEFDPLVVVRSQEWCRARDT